jgi:hypothetical protein
MYSEKTDKHFLSQVIKVNIDSDKSYWQYLFMMGLDEIDIVPLSFPLKNL